MLSLQSFLRERRVVGPCWERLKPREPEKVRSNERFKNDPILSAFWRGLNEGDLMSFQMPGNGSVEILSQGLPALHGYLAHKETPTPL